MRRALLTAALVLAVAPSSALAAPFGELPFRPVSGPASCVGATGLPGELSRWTRGGVELSTASADGIVVQTVVPFGVMRQCPVVVSDPGGFAAMAAATAEGVRIAIREPGAALWSAPTTIPATDATGVQVAVSARGDVLVAWAESTCGCPSRTRVSAVRRAPGEPIGVPQRIVDEAYLAGIAVGLSAAGEGVLATGDLASVRVATAPPDGRFGAPRRLAAGGIFADHLTLAVGGDGRALLACPAGFGLLVFEREPGGAFVRRQIPGFVGALDAAAAIGPGGAAVLAWQLGDGVSLIRRGAGAAFGKPQEITEVGAPQVNGGGEAIITFTYGDGPPTDGQPRLRALLGADGRPTLTWRDQSGTGRVATVGPAGTPDAERVGSPLRDMAALTPLTLADGTRAIAWSDHNPLLSSPPYAGRVHLAVEGAAGAPAAPVPELTIGAPLDASLRPAQALVLPVHCSAACDVRAATASSFFDPGFTLTRAGTRRLHIDPLGKGLAPARPGPLKIMLRWGAPGARVAQERTISVRLRRLPAPPFPRLVHVRARRSAGGVVDVRWSTDVPARDAAFIVLGSHGRARAPSDATSSGTAPGGGKRQFHVRLADASRVRWVRVYASQLVGRRQRIALVRVS